MELAQVPAMVKMTTAAAVTLRVTIGSAHRYSGSHRMIAQMAPQVPGATGRKPTPNDVAIILGKSGNFSAGLF